MAPAQEVAIAAASTSATMAPQRPIDVEGFIRVRDSGKFFPINNNLALLVLVIAFDPSCIYVFPNASVVRIRDTQFASSHRQLFIPSPYFGLYSQLSSHVYTSLFSITNINPTTIKTFIFPPPAMNLMLPHTNSFMQFTRGSRASTTSLGPSLRTTFARPIF